MYILNGVQEAESSNLSTQTNEKFYQSAELEELLKIIKGL